MTTYELTFTDHADREGNVPAWAITQIFDEHGSSYVEFIDSLVRGGELNLSHNAVAILEWLGYWFNPSTIAPFIMFIVEVKHHGKWQPLEGYWPRKLEGAIELLSEYQQEWPSTSYRLALARV